MIANAYYTLMIKFNEIVSNMNELFNKYGYKTFK